MYLVFQELCCALLREFRRCSGPVGDVHVRVCVDRFLLVSVRPALLRWSRVGGLGLEKGKGDGIIGVVG